MEHQQCYQKALPLAPNINNLDMEYCYNDHVDLNDNRQGTIKFIGEISVELNGAIWYGIELKTPKGDNNGSLKGVSYFRCKPNYGTFVQKRTIRWLSSGNDDLNNEINNVHSESSKRFHINQIVKVPYKRSKAEIKWIGEFNKKLTFGIELLDEMGNHSGRIDDKFYFSCGIYRGLFVSQTDLKILDENEEKNSSHNRSSHHLFNKLPSFHDGNGNESDDSDGSIESDVESVSSVNTLMTVDDAVFDRIQLKENETDMAFTQILNKCMYIHNNMYYIHIYKHIYIFR